MKLKMYSINNTALLIATIVLLLLPSAAMSTQQVADALAVILDVSGEVTVQGPDKVVLPVEKEQIIKSGSKITLPKGSSIYWVTRIFNQLTHKELFGPAVINFPGTFEELGQIRGQRTMGGVYRGDNEQKALVCQYSKYIKIPSYKQTLPFMPLTCNQPIRLSKIQYRILQIRDKNINEVVSSGPFLKGINSSTLMPGEYLIQFYYNDNYLVSSKLVIDDRDLFNDLSQTRNSHFSNFPEHISTTLELCKLEYFYLCELNYRYQVFTYSDDKGKQIDHEMIMMLDEMIKNALEYQRN